MNKKIRVIQYGMGPIGAKITQHLVEKSNLKIVGAIDIDPQKVGKDVSEIAGLPSFLGVRISNHFKETMKKTKAEVVILTTASSLEKIYPQIAEILSMKAHIVSTCEELSFPWKTQPKLAKKIDLLAKKYKVSILGTGVNPGFLMDFLPLAMTAVCRNVKKIRIERIQDAQFRRLPFQRKIGAGLTLSEFDKKVKDKTLRHVGLTESMHMIAAALGWKLEKTEELISPIIAEQSVVLQEQTIEAGKALGVCQLGRGLMNGEEVLTLEFRAAVGQSDPHDSIHIEGTPPVHLTIPGGVNGDVATCSIAVNAVAAVLRARPGLRTMADLEPIHYY